MNSPSAVACREVFDENSQPSAEEISEYAQQLGIDPESESHLLPLAKDGLMQALPQPWKAFYDEKVRAHYYFNEETKKTQWEHPLDNVYRELVRKARDVSTHDDTYISVQELTSEDNMKHLERIESKVGSDDDELTTDSENQSEAKEHLHTKQQCPKRLTPLGRPPLAPLTRPFDMKLADLRVSPLRRSIDGAVSFKPGLGRMEKDIGRALERPKLLKQQSDFIDLKMHVLSSPEEENFNLFSSGKGDGTLKSLPLTGKGAMFLRPRKGDLPSPDTEKSITIESVTKSDPPKGILREKLADSFHRKVESLSLGKPRHAASFDDDRKSVRFKLENATTEPTLSPGSNSSSNDGQSSIISATNPNPRMSPLPSSLVPLNQTSSMPNVSSNALLAPLVGRPPLPPRPPGAVDQTLSPREAKSVSGSERDSVESDNRESWVASPRRRILRPPAADYIKQDLFQKSFQKIADLVKPGDIETASVNLEAPSLEKEARPRSPMIPQINKISINLMESIESETSIDSPDKEFANLDLNDMDDIKNDPPQSDRSESDEDHTEEQDEKDNSERISSHTSKLESHSKQDLCSPKEDSPKIPKLDLSMQPQIRTSNTESENSKKLSFREESRNSRSESFEKNMEPKFSPVVKMSPNPSIAFDVKSFKSELAERPPWSPLSSFKPSPIKAAVSPQIKSTDSDPSLSKAVAVKSSDSNPSLSKGLPVKSSDSNPSLSKALPVKLSDSNPSISKSFTSPRLDGVVISQGKSQNGSLDNVVVMYQFDTPKEDPYPKQIKPTELAKEIERNKVEERRRLELALEKDLEELRAEWAEKEKVMRIELEEELRKNEERFEEEKRVKLIQQADRLRKEMEQSLQECQQSHDDALSEAKAQYEERLRKEVQSAEETLRQQLQKMRDEHAERLALEKRQLESETERALFDLRQQETANLQKERARVLEERNKTLDTLKEEQTARVTELRHDYRAEVERLRTQHSCHLEEIRGRLCSERAAATRRGNGDALPDKYKCLKEKYARLKRDVKMSIERRNKRREMSMTTGSETEKSNSHKATQSLERCKELNETSTSADIEPLSSRSRAANQPLRRNDNETSVSESRAQKPADNNNVAVSPESSPRQPRVAFREPPRRRLKERENKQTAAHTDYQDSSDATTADEKPKEAVNGHGRRRCFTRLKSASTSRLNYSPKRGEGWSSPLEALRQQLRKLDDLEDQFPDLACQPSYTLRYPFTELGAVSTADTPELEFVRHRALVEREGMRRARAALRRRRAALHESRAASPQTAPEEEREATELEVALHRARALLGEKEIRLRHIERALRRLADSQPAVVQEGASDGSSGSGLDATGEAAAPGAVLRSLRALHADVRDIWLALDARRLPVSPETSSCNAASSPQPRISLSVQEPARPDTIEGGVAERARSLRAWLQTAP